MIKWAPTLRRLLSRQKVSYFFKFFLTKRVSRSIILIMEKAKETAKRPSKKVLMAEIEAKGVDTKIVQSLGRANIETLVWVKGLIS